MIKTKVTHNYFDIILKDKDGNIKEQHRAYNMLLKGYFEACGNSLPGVGSIDLGTSSVEPTFTDTKLGSLKISKAATSVERKVVDKDNGYCRYFFEFSAESFEANLTEMGLRGSVLLTKALIRDSEGAAISIVKTYTDILQIYATFYYMISVDPNEDAVHGTFGKDTMELLVTNNSPLYFAYGQFCTVNTNIVSFNLTLWSQGNTTNPTAITEHDTIMKKDTRTFIVTEGNGETTRIAFASQLPGSRLKVNDYKNMDLPFVLMSGKFGSFVTANKAVATGDGTNNKFALPHAMVADAEIIATINDIETACSVTREATLLSAIQVFSPYNGQYDWYDGHEMRKGLISAAGLITSYAAALDGDELVVFQTMDIGQTSTLCKIVIKLKRNIVANNCIMIDSYTRTELSRSNWLYADRYNGGCSCFMVLFKEIVTGEGSVYIGQSRTLTDYYGQRLSAEVVHIIYKKAGTALPEVLSTRVDLLNVNTTSLPIGSTTRRQGGYLGLSENGGKIWTSRYSATKHYCVVYTVSLDWENAGTIINTTATEIGLDATKHPTETGRADLTNTNLYPCFVRIETSGGVVSTGSKLALFVIDKVNNTMLHAYTDDTITYAPIIYAMATSPSNGTSRMLAPFTYKNCNDAFVRTYGNYVVALDGATVGLYKIAGTELIYITSKVYADQVLAAIIVDGYLVVQLDIPTRQQALNLEIYEFTDTMDFSTAVPIVTGTTYNEYECVGISYGGTVEIYGTDTTAISNIEVYDALCYEDDEKTVTYFLATTAVVTQMIQFVQYKAAGRSLGGKTYLSFSMPPEPDSVIKATYTCNSIPKDANYRMTVDTSYRISPGTAPIV